MKEKIKNLNKTNLNSNFQLLTSNYKGITLIALIITIVIMLILATVTIGAINGGLFSYAGRAKTSVEETSTKEAIQQAYIMAKGKSRTNRVSEAQMQKQVDNVLQDENAQVAGEGDKLIVIIGEKYYEVDNNGKVTGPGTLEPVPNAGDVTKGGTCTGTESNPYRIECIEDLVAFSKNVNTGTFYSGKYIVLVKDLDFNSIFSYANYKEKYKFDSSKNAYIKDGTSETTIKELCTSGSGFIPITNNGPTSSSAFCGTFDGQEHIISNIYIDGKDTTYNKGFFGKLYNATVKNLTIDGLIKGKVTGGGGMGGIASSASNGYILNCVNKATVEGKNCYTAGIICSGSSTVVNCRNDGIVRAISPTDMANVYGIGRASSINKCCNTGTLAGEGKVLLCAIGNGTVKNCYNTSDLGDENAGAVLGVSRWRCFKLL